MNQKLLEQYAEMCIKVGVRIEKGDELWINANLDQPEFVTMVVEQAYKAGAKKVIVRWNHDPVNRLTNKYATLGTLSKVAPYELARWKYASKKMPAMLHIISDDPDAMKGINQAKIAKARMRSYPKIKKYRDVMDGHYKWCIVAVPGKAWAKKVFPNLNEDEAVESLWNAILKCARVDENNTTNNWVEHNKYLVEKSKKLRKLNLKCLDYEASNGTNFHVELIPNCLWGAGIETTAEGKKFNPNMPTEEVFTSPQYGKAEGKLVASKPLSYMGKLIEDFSITFKDGKVIKVEARKNQDALEHMVKMDEGASMLGEVALVPYTSPINQTGILFYETLFDENACCHFALGAGFGECIDGGSSMTPEQLKEKGINDSMIHVDFMIGTSDLSIIGTTKDNKKVQIFKDGVWAI